jgi:hypothetical protein
MRITLLLSASLLGCLIIFAASADASGGDSQPQQPVRSFKKLQLSDKFWAEGVAIADVNRDGHMDVISGPYWYEGLDFKKRHAIFPATHTFTRKRTDGTAEQVEGYEGALGISNAYSEVQFVFVWDFNGDGWPDVLTIGFPGNEASWLPCAHCLLVYPKCWPSLPHISQSRLATVKWSNLACRQWGNQIVVDGRMEWAPRGWVCHPAIRT